jgi:hypothetical protein
MQGGKKKLSSWNIFVKKIYQEGHAKNKDYSFKQALTDASKRKGEMKSSTAMASKKSKKMSKKMGKKTKGKRSMTMSMTMAGGKTRKHRRR